MTKVAPGASPCRAHPCSLEHTAMVLTFRELARTWQAEAERQTGGYAADLATYRESHPPPRLGDFLIHYHRERRADRERTT